MKFKLFALPVLLTLSTVGMKAATIVLTFEGVQDGEYVQNFYNGGTASLGSSGTNYGISFGSDTLAVRDYQTYGNGNTANDPSGTTTIAFLAGAATMNVAAGFDTGFSFFYAAPFATGSVNVYDAVGGATGGGNLLATISLPTTVNGGLDLGTYPACVDTNGDPVDFCPWFNVGVAFSGIAKSVDFGGSVNQAAFDNITLGSNVAIDTNGIPEPATFLLIGSGLIALASFRRKLVA